MERIHSIFKLAKNNFLFFLATVVATLAANGNSVLLAQQEELTDVIERCEKAVIRIEVSSSQGDSLGSGYIVEPDGMFVTNVHVLAGAQKAVAFFPDGRSYEIKGTYFVDENRDICVGQIAGEDLPVLKLAKELPRKGSQVVALGSPHGLSFSATRGIVSAIRKQEEARAQIGRPNMEGTWIQVDAAISGGNSGGPLINPAGEVVGMSTLGSNSGAAQNLNFGISVDDIRMGIESAKKSKLVALKDNVGNVDMDEVSPESGEMISRGEIPAKALEEYIERARQQYDELTKTLRKAGTDASKKLGLMRKGETYIPGGGGDYEVVVEKRQRLSDRYYFRNDSVKRREVARQQSHASKLQEVKDNLGRDADNESLFTLLMHGGPRLDPRNANEVGFMTQGIVLHAFNEHDVAVLYDDQPYLMWVKSTTGLSSGQEISPTPVFVAGTETLEIPGFGSQSVTILNSVMESEVRKAVFGDEPTSIAKGEYRTWTDSTGKFEIEATLEESNDIEVVLKKRDGSIIKVPLDKLSDGDKRLIGK